VIFVDGLEKTPSSVIVEKPPNDGYEFSSNVLKHICIEDYLQVSNIDVGAFLQATSRVPRWWIGERPPDMAASCDIYK